MNVLNAISGQFHVLCILAPPHLQNKRNLQDLVLRKEFLDLTLKAQSIKGITGKLDDIIIENF